MKKPIRVHCTSNRKLNRYIDGWLAAAWMFGIQDTEFHTFTSLAMLLRVDSSDESQAGPVQVLLDCHDL